jgi:dihydrolipoamide dehydrogenase
MTRMRTRIAERLVEAQATAAMLTSFNEVDLGAVMEIRKRYRDSFEKKHGVRIGFMSFFAKAAIEALRKFPVVNASIEGSDIIYHDYFDIGIAVSTERGLMVPVLRDADLMSFADIERSIGDFAVRARDGKIGVEDLSGGTFTITNGGVFGSLMSTPIINPAAERDPRHAQDPGSGDGGGRRNQDPADDVHRADLRPPHHRRPRGGAVPGEREGEPGGPGAPPDPALTRFEPRCRRRARPCAGQDEQCIPGDKMSDSFDVIVIGGGPGGYPAAIRAAQNGMSAACIDDWQNYDGSRAFGGTCLNAGCIPSKALLESSELFHRAKEEFGVHGIKTGAVELDLDVMQARKAGIVKQLTGGIGQLFKANKVTGLQGRGRFLGDGKVEFTDPDGNTKTLTAKHVVLAAGSRPIELKSVPFDGQQVVDSWGALEFDAVPGTLGVIGAGVIGLELGSVWKRLGAEVTILEALDTFLPTADAQIARDAQRQFKKQGLEIRLGAKVQGAKTSKKGVTLSYEDKDGSHELTVDKVVVCVGRRPCSDGLLGEGTGVEIDERGFVKVDHECRTGVKNVWAVGDLVRGPMLAHKATEEGVMVADLIAGKIAEVNYEVIPSVIYTAPEIAWVGKTEAQAKEAGSTTRSALSRSRRMVARRRWSRPAAW